MHDSHHEVLQATTLLDAVNVLLQSIGEAPISTLEEADVDAEAAIRQIMQTSREVQGSGWHFNTEIGMKLLPEDESGFVRLPKNTLKVDEIWPENLRHGSDIVQRGLRLYDRRQHTYTFDRPVRVTLTVLLPFDELPQYARTYIAIKAARKFAQDETASDSTYRFTKDDEEEALVRFEQAEGDHEDANMRFDSPFIRAMMRR